MRRACVILLFLALLAVCFSVFAEDNEAQSICLFINGYMGNEGELEEYLEQIRSKTFPDLKSIEIAQLVPDDNSTAIITVQMFENAGGIYILPRSIFFSLSYEGFLLPLEDDEELMTSVGNDDIAKGWRNAGDEIHLYGIPLAILPGANQYFYVEDGFVCAFAGDADPEDVKALLRILCQDFK